MNSVINLILKNCYAFHVLGGLIARGRIRWAYG